MSGRAAPWRTKPSQALQELLCQLARPPSSNESSNSWYVLQRLGPASFVVGHDPGGNKFKVTLGNQPTCTCWLESAALAPAGGREPCAHLLFIMLRVMRLAADNPLLWQSALTDRELQELLDGRLASPARSRATVRHRTHTAQNSTAPEQGTGVQRRCVEQGEACPICYEDLSVVDPACLVWCSNSCGRSVHGNCMRVWSEHQTKTLCQELSCPLCRCLWGPLNWTPPRIQAASTKAAAADVSGKPCHRGVRCCGCQQSPIEGSRYRCLECASYNLCGTCFTAGCHLYHSFVSLSTPTAAELIAERPMHLELHCSGFAHATDSPSMGIKNGTSNSAREHASATDCSHSRIQAKLYSRCGGTSSSAGTRVSKGCTASGGTCGMRAPTAADSSMQHESLQPLGLNCSSIVPGRCDCSNAAHHGSSSTEPSAASTATNASSAHSNTKSSTARMLPGTSAAAAAAGMRTADVPAVEQTALLELHYNRVTHSHAGGSSADILPGHQCRHSKRATDVHSSSGHTEAGDVAGSRSCTVSCNSSGCDMARSHRSDTVPCKLQSTHGHTEQRHDSKVHSKQKLVHAAGTPAGNKLAPCITSMSAAVLSAVQAAPGKGSVAAGSTPARAGLAGPVSDMSTVFQCHLAGVAAVQSPIFAAKPRQSRQTLRALLHQKQASQHHKAIGSGNCRLPDAAHSAALHLQHLAVCGSAAALVASGPGPGAPRDCVP